jgi:glycosyltransferase involved in cell wall biosynthesis
MPCKWEGFGLVFLEAMAYAQPIIAGNLDAAREVVGDTALLVDPDDSEDLAKAIVTLLSNADLHMRLGQAGRARLAEHFTYLRFRTSLMAVLEQAVACKRPMTAQVAD